MNLRTEVDVAQSVRVGIGAVAAAIVVLGASTSVMWAAATPPDEDAAIAGLVGAAAGVVLLLAWLGRLWRNRVASSLADRMVGTPMLMRVMAATAGRAYRPTVALSPDPPAPGERYQPVMFEPQLVGLVGTPTPVTVYAYLDRTRRAVVEMADGHRLTPIGRLGRRRPRHSDVVAPASHAPVPPRTVLRGLTHRVWVLVVMAYLGYDSAGLAGAATAVACGTLLALAAWAWTGADPRRTTWQAVVAAERGAAVARDQVGRGGVR